LEPLIDRFNLIHNDIMFYSAAKQSPKSAADAAAAEPVVATKESLTTETPVSELVAPTAVATEPLAAEPLAPTAVAKNESRARSVYYKAGIAALGVGAVGFALFGGVKLYRAGVGAGYFRQQE
jgi:hypothetical protein